ncbi:MAG: hypothetical protein R3D62_03095 [Xanthobacteraceae bacterium]
MGLRAARHRSLNNGALWHAGNERPGEAVGLCLEDGFRCEPATAPSAKSLLQDVGDLVDQQSEAADARRIEMASPEQDTIVDGKRLDTAPADSCDGFSIDVNANGRKVRPEPLLKPASQRTIKRKSGIAFRSDQRRRSHETSPSWLAVAQWFLTLSVDKGHASLSKKMKKDLIGFAYAPSSPAEWRRGATTSALAAAASRSPASLWVSSSGRPVTGVIEALQ